MLLEQCTPPGLKRTLPFGAKLFAFYHLLLLLSIRSLDGWSSCCLVVASPICWSLGPSATSIDSLLWANSNPAISIPRVLLQAEAPRCKRVPLARCYTLVFSMCLRLKRLPRTTFRMRSSSGAGIFLLRLGVRFSESRGWSSVGLTRFVNLGCKRSSSSNCRAGCVLTVAVYVHTLLGCKRICNLLLGRPA